MTAQAGGTELRLHRQSPRPTPESQPFWDGCARHELLIQRCRAHGHFWFPPANFCQRCWSPDFTWTPVSGQGALFTFTIYRRAYAPGLADQLPYAVGIVELAEGPRLVTNVVGCTPEELRVGMHVEVVFQDLADGISLHAFRPRAGRA